MVYMRHQYLFIEDDKVLQEFFDCPTIAGKFLNLNKLIPQKYRVTIEHLGDADAI